jgi:hypothetical protein
VQIFDSYWTENRWQYPPIVGKFGYIGSAATMKDADTFWYFRNCVSLVAMPNIGGLASWQMEAILHQAIIREAHHSSVFSI